MNEYRKYEGNIFAVFSSQLFSKNTLFGLHNSIDMGDISMYYKCTNIRSILEQKGMNRGKAGNGSSS